MKIPSSTYRLQFTPSFGFKEAREIVNHLYELGISAIYASPIFKARKGSTHGYDIVDPNSLNRELGTEEEFNELIKDLKDREIGWIQDIVPNHMAYDSDNHALMDIFENGRCSKYFNYFDIEWDHPYESIRERILTPFLGKTYADSLVEGEITLAYESEGFSVKYYDLTLPLKIESYLSVLANGIKALKQSLGEDNPDYIKFLGVLYVLKNLPSSEENLDDRYEQIRFVKRLLWELYSEDDKIRRYLDEAIVRLNGQQGDPESFNQLDMLLSEQNFRLSFWKFATEEINYRRFFNINQLISVRVEDEEVFNHTHSLIFRLINGRSFDGLRVDHADGLFDPTDYLMRLRDKTKETYIAVEKILDFEEELPEIWPVQGTTGYDFLNHVNSLYCNKENERVFNKIYSNFSGLQRSYECLVARNKRLIIEKHMAGDVDNLALLMKSISTKDRHGSDITLYGLKGALVEVMALFPVYRTYISKGFFSETDFKYIRWAVSEARQTNPGLLTELNFIERILLSKSQDNDDGDSEYLKFIMRFQQFTGPLMAKGFEDTTLYVYNRLLSLNDVGGAPNRFGIPVKEFHEFNITRRERWPNSMNATSTHDTKRGEDVRARINVLSEIPKEWETKLKYWNKISGKKKRKINGISVPDKNDEYFLYQTLIGSFPTEESKYIEFKMRIKSYMIKAIREAKVHTAWLKPDVEYEDSFLSFIDKIMDESEENIFLGDFIPFQKKIAIYGMFNSLSQTLLKVTSPGVPDFYQGTELWDLSLVDPDNRRPVDFALRYRYLNEIKDRGKEDRINLINDLLYNKHDGRIKLFLTYKALGARNKRRELFERGSYIPLTIKGEYKNHVVAFARKLDKTLSITVVPIFLTSIIDQNEFPLGDDVWKDTCLVVPSDCQDAWKDVFTDQIHEEATELGIGRIFNHLPVSLLMNVLTE